MAITDPSASVSPFRTTAAGVDTLIVDALRDVAAELPSLAAVADLRYERAIFPTIGQYDWALGQILYALVRCTRPRRVIELSTSSGYSTSFIALALQRNGVGLADTVDIDANAQRAAATWLGQLGASDRIRLHTGDCRKVVPEILDDHVDLLFIDTLHSFDIAEWYLGEVIPRLNPRALVHIHDVMPPEARVRIHGGPPYPAEPVPKSPNAIFLLKRFAWLLLHGKRPNPFPARRPREMLPLHTLATHPGVDDEHLSIDGNYFEEATLIRELLRDSSPSEAVYVHRIIASLALIDPQRYASQDRIQRTDARGVPAEWNDALWCRAQTLQERADPRRVRTLIAGLRTRHYRS